MKEQNSGDPFGEFPTDAHDMTAEQAIALANNTLPRVCWYSSSDGRVELAIAFDDAAYGYHSGQCDSEIAELAEIPYIKEQLGEIPGDIAREVAIESGRNDHGSGDQDNNDHDANLRWLLWMACGDIVENAT